MTFYMRGRFRNFCKHFFSKSYQQEAFVIDVFSIFITGGLFLQFHRVFLTDLDHKFARKLLSHIWLKIIYHNYNTNSMLSTAL